eukprot:766651-Pelagomonas_calceolata.AAC.4
MMLPQEPGMMLRPAMMLHRLLWGIRRVCNDVAPYLSLPVGKLADTSYHSSFSAMLPGGYVPYPPSLSTTHSYVLNRQGSTAELRLLAAEFGYLDEQLAALASQTHTYMYTRTCVHTQVGSSARAVGVSSVEGNGSSYRGAAAIGGVGDSLVMEDLLASLANDVPDMRQRVGVP